MSNKCRVAVLYGGKSGEHEISLRSAYSVMTQLDPARYDVVPIGIDKQGRWLLNQLPEVALPDCPEVILHSPSSQEIAVPQVTQSMNDIVAQCDVIFPVLHGPLYEDGCLQGLLRLAEKPFVGPGVLSSAVSMDKVFAKIMADSRGIATAKGRVVHKRSLDLAKECAQIANDIEFPVFVKPASCGSSLGTHQVKQADELLPAVQDALRFDHKALIEQAIVGQEIELAVLENPDNYFEPLVSIAGEIVTSDDDFYSYEAKYLSEDAAKLLIPAQLTPSQMADAQRIAKEIFLVMECEGMARVDLFFDKTAEKFYFNELNTLPGFTSISMYPKLWEASGIAYSDLLSKLIDCALAAFERQSTIERSL